MYYKLSQISITPRSYAGTTSEIFIGQVDVEKEMLAGKLFIIIEIESNESEDLKIINFLIEDISKQYYQSEKIIYKEHSHNLKVDLLLETTLANSNKKLLKYCAEHKINLNHKFINVTVGVIHKDNIFFSTFGKNKALLIAKSKDEEGVHYKIYDILKAAKGSDTNNPDNSSIFSNIINGKLPKGGYIVFSNEALPEYISNKQLIKIITSLPPAGAVEQIKYELSHINEYITFLGVIIKSTVGQNVEKTKEIQHIKLDSSESSIINLNNTERATEKFLAPSGIINFQKWFDMVGGIISSNSGKIKANSDKIFHLGEKMILKKQRNLFSLNKIYDYFKSVLYYIVKITSYLFSKIKSLFTLRELPKVKPVNIKSWPINTISSILTLGGIFLQWLKNLKLSHKIYLGVLLICAVLFIQNLVRVNDKNNNEVVKQVYSDLAKNIEQKQNQIDSNLLYNKNEADLKKLLSDMKQLLDSIPQNDPVQKQIYDKYYKLYQDRLGKIEHVVKINAPQELINFNSLNPAALPSNLVMLGNNIFTADNRNSSVYAFDITKGSPHTITSPELSNNLNSPSIDKNYIFYLGRGNIIIIDTSNNKISTSTFPSDASSTIDLMQLYNNKLYAIDKKNGLIIKYKRSGSRFNSPVNWLKDTADLSLLNGFGIDGNIYLALNNGKVLKYFSGSKVNFQLDAVEPVLENPKNIFASPDSKFLYILEPKNKRLLVYNKDGKYQLQYSFDGFNNLKDFTVDEKSKTVYILNNTSVYKFPIQDLFAIKQ